MNKKGFASIIVPLVLLGLLVVGGGIWYYEVRKSELPQSKDQSVPSITTQTNQSSTVQNSGQSQANADSSSTIFQAVTKNFDYPYPISWQEPWSYVYNNVDWGDYNTSFSLTGVSIGEKTVPSNQNLYKTRAGQKVYAITLLFKINTTVKQSQGQYCVPLTLRQIVNEQGDKSAPLESYWLADNQSCVQGRDVTYNSEAVTFEISPSDKDLLFTSGGKANVFFSVKLKDDGTIDVQKEPQSESDNTVGKTSLLNVTGSGIYSTLTDQASLDVHVYSGTTLVGGLSAANFSLKTNKVAPGSCMLFLDNKRFISEMGMGHYVIPIASGCVWASGQYDITLTASTSSGQGIANIIFSVPAKTSLFPPGSPSPLSVKITDPVGKISINRGNNLAINWTATGGSPSSTIYFILSSTSTGQQQSLSAPAYSLQKSIKITIPPGSYTLSAKDYSYGYGSFSNTSTVTVLGVSPAVSVSSSSVESDYDEIVNDGICETQVDVYLVDDYGYGIRGKRVDLKSDKSSDTIVPTALYSDSSGEIDFYFKSTNIGTSTLSAFVEGNSTAIITQVSVLDARDNDCPSIGDYTP